MSGTSTSHRTKGPLALAALLAVGMALAACGSSSSSANSTTTTSTSGAGSAGNAGGAADNLSSMTSLATAGKSATFEAVYTYKSSGKTQTITFAQAPPQSLFKVGTTGQIINTGTKTYLCGVGTCYASSTTSNPLQSLTYLFDGQTFLDNVAAYSATAAALAAKGITLTYSTSSFAGQSSRCVTVHSSKSKVKTFTWCVATNGIMTSWNAGNGKASFTLTSFTTTPPASDFQVPPSYKVLGTP